MISDGNQTCPFEDATVDLFSLGGYEYLVFTDKLSGWPMVGRYSKTASASDMTKLIRRWISDVGVPNRLATNGGSQFKSAKFAAFCKDWPSHMIQVALIIHSQIAQQKQRLKP